LFSIVKYTITVCFDHQAFSLYKEAKQKDNNVLTIPDHWTVVSAT